MTTRMHRLWQTPQPLSPLQAKVIGVIAVFILLLAASGLFLDEGWPRVVHVSALALMGLANLLYALGSLLPEERGGRRLREAMVPLAWLMLVALFASLAVYWRSEEGISIGSLIGGGIAGLVASLALRRRRGGSA